MAMVNAKKLRLLLDYLIKKEGRMPTVKEMAAAMRGDNKKIIK